MKRLSWCYTVANFSRSFPSSFLTRRRRPTTALHGPHQLAYTSITKDSQYHGFLANSCTVRLETIYLSTYFYSLKIYIPYMYIIRKYMHTTNVGEWIKISFPDELH